MNHMEEMARVHYAFRIVQRLIIPDELQARIC